MNLLPYLPALPLDTACYVLTAALHGLILSLAAWLTVRALRQHSRRALAAALGLTAAALAPWVTASATKGDSAPTDVRFTDHQTEKPSRMVWKISIQDSRMPEVQDSAPGAATRPGQFPKVMTLAGMIWAIGFGVSLIHMGWSAGRLAILRRKHEPVGQEDRARIGALAPDLELPAKVEVFPGKGGPCVAGWWRPCLMLPSSGVAEWNAAEWRWVLRHEGGHLRGGDVLLHGLLTMMRLLWWWNPFMKSLLGSWAAAREEACDLASLQSPDEAVGYARFLLRIAAENSVFHPAVPNMAAARPAVRLRRRIVAALRWDGQRSSVSRRFVLSFLVTVAVMLAVLMHTGIRAEADKPNLEVTVTDKATPAPVGPSVSPVQIYAKTVWVETDVSGPIAKILDGAAISQAEFQDLTKQWGQSPQTDIRSSPSVTTRIGQRATVEVVREFPSEKDPKAAPDFVGIRNEIEVALSGERLRIVTIADIGDWVPAPIGKERFSMRNPPVAGAKIVHKIRKLVTEIPSDKVVCLRMGEMHPGKVIWVFLSVSTIDSKGQTVGVPEAVKSWEQHQQEAMRPPDPGETRRRKKPVKIALQLVEYRHAITAVPDGVLGLGGGMLGSEDLPKLGFVDQKTLLTPQSSTKADAAGDKPGLLDFSDKKPGQYPVIAGVFTEPQQKALLQILAKKKGVRMYDPVETTATSEKTAQFNMQLPEENLSYAVEPVIGPDEYTIDLSIETPSSKDSRRVTTAVTIWNGQTVVIGGTVKSDQKETLSRFILVTAKIAP